MQEGDGDDQTSPASSAVEDNDTLTDELRDFRKDNDAQLRGIREDINKTNKRMEEAEERIMDA